MLCNGTDVLLEADCEKDELCFIQECCLGPESCQHPEDTDVFE